MGGKLPNVVGYVDGTLIKIKKPPINQNRRAFMGRKHFAAVNVMITCDRRLYIQNVVARHPGSTHDSHISAFSALRRQMIHINNNMRQCVLLGDSGFALEPWLMPPFARAEEPEENTPEARYNRDLCMDRCHVERAIGCMKERFRAINNERVLHYDPLVNNQVELDVAADGHRVLARGRAVRAHMVQYLEQRR